MKPGVSNTLPACLLLIAFSSLLAGPAAAAQVAKSGSQPVQFRDDDFRAQRIARQLLGKEIARPGDRSSGSDYLRTSWANVEHGASAELFVMHDCSPTGNCRLSGFEPAKRGWRPILSSLVQRCSILASTHGGWHDISCYMHGSAIEGTVKTYWWRRNRYVRVSERDLVFN